MKKNIGWFLLIAALFAAMLFNPSVRPVSAQDGTQYEDRGTAIPVPPEHLLQRIEMKNKLRTGEIAPAPQEERPQQSQWPVPSYEDQRYIHEWTSGVYSAFNFSTGDYDLLMRLTILNDPVVIAATSGDELYPRLARDSSAVIFSSDEFGDMEIYWMRIDGNGKTNLTNSPGDDYSAVWSLDNQWIVYVHEIGGLPQIFLMRSDGSEQQQITHCSLGCFDPTLSPDASQIAYVEKFNSNSGETRIIVGKRDGSNKRILFSNANIFFPAHPTWSPEGNWIYFDYYQYPSFFSRMGRVHPDGSGLVYNLSIYPYEEGYATDYWVNGWGPDSGSITVTVLHYVPDGTGQYVFNGSDVIISSGYGDMSPLGYRFVMAEGGAAFFPDFQSADRTPPQSTLTPLADFSRGIVLLEWNASSTGLARPTELQLQRRDGLDGAWQDITEPISTIDVWHLPHDQFVVPAGEPGKVTYFRIRVKDAAQQWEAWSESTNQMVLTTNYVVNVKGRVFDNRNLPMANQVIEFSSLPLIGSRTDAEGLFQTLFSTQGPFMMSISRDGYGELAPVQLPAQRDAGYDSYLPPVMNLITNGDFESGLSGWITGGNFPVQVRNSSKHTGQYSLTLGEGCASPCFSTTGEFIADGNDYSSHLVDDLHGALYAFQGRTIRYRENNGSWIGPIDLGSGIAEGLVSSSGRFYAILQKTEGFWGVYRDPGGEWSEQFFIGRIGSANRIFFDDVDVDENNQLHFVATISDVQSNYLLNHYQFNPDSGILSETTVDILNPSEQYSVNHIPGGNVLLTNFSYGELTYYVRDNAGKWRKYYQSNPPVGVYGDSYVIGLDANNQLLLLRADNQEDGTNKLTMLTMDSYLNWSEPLTINSAINLFVNQTTRCPDGTVLFSVGDYGTLNQIFRMGKENIWELTSFQLPDNAYRLGCDSDGIPIIETLDNYHDSRLFRIADDSAAGTVEAAQQVTIPADMEKTTLSFAFRLENVRLTQQTSFEVIVRDASNTEIIVLENKQSGDWRQEWADLSSWAGQTVTIIFRLNQAANEPKARAWIDGVSLGSWDTLFVDSVEPFRFILPEDAPVLTVHGQNFHDNLTIQINGINMPQESITRLDENTLTITTPNFIRPGFNSVRAINPGGAYDELLLAFRTGLDLFLPVVSR